ncbi:MAG: autotransporter domain-containing protein [Prosthecobacter sp.]
MTTTTSLRRSLRRLLPAAFSLSIMLTVGALPQAAQGQTPLYFGVYDGVGGGRVVRYDPATDTYNPSFITGFEPIGMAVHGNTLFVADSSSSQVRSYDYTTGALINASFIPVVSWLASLLVVQDTLFLGSDRSLNRYNPTTGAFLSSTPNDGISALAQVPGGILSARYGLSNLTLYDALTGSVLNDRFLQVEGLSFTSLAVWGNNLYAFDTDTDRVALYDASTGALINSSFVVLSRFAGVDTLVAVDGKLYVPDSGSGLLAMYDATTGQLLDPAVLPEAVSGFTSSLARPAAMPDLRPQISAQTTGLAYGNATGQVVMSGVNGMLADINGHLFGLRAGSGDDDGGSGGLTASMDEGVVLGEGDGPENNGRNPVARSVARSSQWEVFTTVNFANVSLETMGTQPGVDSYSWTPGLGVEKRVAPGVALGFAASLMESHQTYANGLGTLETEGFALSTYASYVKRDYWIDLLYSFGRFDLDAERNPGFAFPVARGETTAYTNAVQLNGGWKFHIPQWRVTHGPFAGIDYLNVKVDSYNELGGGAAALAYASQSIDSLVTRIGYSVSKRIDTSFPSITPQLRVSYERQNISNNNGTSVSLINQPFTASTNAQSPGQDYLVAGASVNVQFNPALNLMVTYHGQFFRQDMQAHHAGVQLSYKF